MENAKVMKIILDSPVRGGYKLNLMKERTG